VRQCLVACEKCVACGEDNRDDEGSGLVSKCSSTTANGKNRSLPEADRRGILEAGDLMVTSDRPRKRGRRLTPRTRGRRRAKRKDVILGSEKSAEEKNFQSALGEKNPFLGSFG
jgi:hypothetical protein